MKVKDIFDFLDAMAPYDTQCSWDNSGLMTGSYSARVSGIAVALDCTLDAIMDAKTNHCNLIVCHHPLIFKPVSHVDSGTPLYEAVKNEISVISCHTNFDMADGGVNDVLAELLQLKNIKKMMAEGKPLMRSGKTDFDSVDDFASFCARKLGNSVKFYDAGRSVKNVAVCSGAGGEYVMDAFHAGCDTLVTGEAKHHEYLDAVNLGVNLIVAGHYSTENPAMEILTKRMIQAFPDMKIIFDKGAVPYETVI